MVESTPSSFTIGEWRVHPQLNRLSRADGEEVQLEPKMMDVLVRLAQTPGEVVSRETLIDAVWPEVFISESVLTRAIAGLRRALGDDARTPRFIETISKRGYRLVASASPATGGGRAATALPGGSYVVGQWVRAEGFYGRSTQIAEALDGPRNGFWVVGTRRRGKTSLLKQLEHLAITGTERRLLPVFWDLQGVDGMEALAFSLEEALADAEEGLHELGVGLDELLDDDVFRMLSVARRLVYTAGWTLFLLCDEAESLQTIAEQSESMIGRLRRALLAHDGVRTVLASGPRLWDLATGSATSPFLDGFLPPLYLGALGDDSARSLVRQVQLVGEHRPELADHDVDTICRWGAGHPFLLQLLSKRLLELGDVEEAVAAVAVDRSVASLFQVDWELLDDEQQSLLDAIATRDVARLEARSTAVVELEDLGLVRRVPNGQPEIGVPMLLDWLRR
jgi:DNA-binding winged helix-turn-helix (wHTH) protein